MTADVDCVVVGAGVVGLAIARALALAGREVVILEATTTIGSETSSRNSEVIHAGLYYPPGSLKARLCLAGRRRLYDYCASRGIAHRRVEKLVVATMEDQLPSLKRLQQTARANGADDLEPLDGPAARGLEPALRCVAALRSPSTGIIDSHGLMLSLLGEAEAAGAMLALNSPVLGGGVAKHGFTLDVGGTEPMRLSCRRLVNAAGLHAQDLARRLDGLPPDTVPPLFLAKGNYFTLAGRSPFRRLIYPMPEAAGLGIHLGLDLAGQARFGPDVEWVDRIDYGVDPSRATQFYAAIRRYYPDLADDVLLPGYAGVRPKLQGLGDPAADFVIQGADRHGIAGLVNLYGIESPGLTSALAIGDLVASRLG
ncbi:NAD(P)/FAD-dependent oxidoreductase [Rhodospirillaceae bacterium SYSU D60014]|uniref:NAD(P)/FAD-dependent oxidoreductase n=1 Tax=Virgifigura deserti TaxID=2268457 RepID=UPI000E6680D3